MNGGARSGSALLIVLSFMALMTAGAVMFSISMRASRLPLTNVACGERGRFLLNAALSRAMSEIDDDLGERFAVDWPERVMGAETLSATNDVVPVLTFEALAYLPPGLIETVRSRAICASTASWQRLDFDAGRIAYLAVDVSDLPDVNHISAVTKRTATCFGRLTLAPFFETTQEAQAFDSKLATARSAGEGLDFVSLLDLNLALGSAEEVLSGRPVSMPLPLVVDSETSSADEVRCSALVSLTDGDAAVKSVLEKKLTESDLEVLADYLDEDSIPSSLEIPCAEHVPQIGAVEWVPGEGVKTALSYPFRDELPEDEFAVVVHESEVDGDEEHTQVDVVVELEDSSGATVDRTAKFRFVRAEKGGYRVKRDARVNWRMSDWTEMTTSAKEWTDELEEEGAFVSNLGRLYSVGELENLPREDGTEIDIDAIGLVDDRGEGAKVNPLTMNTNIVMMALMNTPVNWRAAAGKDDSRTLEEEFGANRKELTQLAVRLMDAFKSCPTGDSYAAYDALDWLDDGWGEDPLRGLSFAAKLTRSERRFLRDYWRGCFAKRNQLFLVFTRVEYGPRGVAVVSRDPYPNIGGAPHRMKVLFYHQFDQRF